MAAVTVAAAAVIATVIFLPRGSRDPVDYTALASIEPLPVRISRSAVEPGTFEVNRHCAGSSSTATAITPARVPRSRKRSASSPATETLLYLGSSASLAGNFAHAATHLEAAVATADAPALREEALWQLANARLALNDIPAAKVGPVDVVELDRGRADHARELLGQVREMSSTRIIPALAPLAIGAIAAPARASTEADRFGTTHRAQYERGELVLAIDHAGKEVARRRSEADSLELATALHDLGTYLADDSRNESALACLEESIALRRARRVLINGCSVTHVCAFERLPEDGATSRPPNEPRATPSSSSGNSPTPPTRASVRSTWPSSCAFRGRSRTPSICSMRAS